MVEQLDAIKNSMDDFSMSIYHQIASERENSNIFLSPLSISSAILLTYVGAESETRSEIESALGIQKYFGENRDAVLQAFDTVFKVFLPSADEHGQKAFDLFLANKVYISRSVVLKPEYLAAIAEHLHTEVGLAPFLENHEKARREINEWVAKQTNGKINGILGTGAVDPSTLMILVNAIYFKANWLRMFDEKLTTKQDFHNWDGQTVKVDMMVLQKQKFSYFDSEQVNLPLPPFQMIKLHYTGREMSMLILLPRSSKTLGELEKALTGDLLGKIHGSCSSHKVDVWLPKFKLEETYDLVGVLSALGMKRLFGAGADFIGIANEKLMISGVTHKAFVEVNEEGTEAAAATAIRMTRSLVIEQPTAEFRADRPFLFLIQHENTGLITFVGRLATLTL